MMVGLPLVKEAAEKEDERGGMARGLACGGAEVSVGEDGGVMRSVEVDWSCSWRDCLSVLSVLTVRAG